MVGSFSNFVDHQFVLAPAPMALKTSETDSEKLRSSYFPKCNPYDTVSLEMTWTTSLGGPGQSKMGGWEVQHTMKRLY